MKAIGMSITIDSLGRCVIPKGLREAFGLEKPGEIEILATSEGILIRNIRYRFVEIKGCAQDLPKTLECDKIDER